MTAVSALAAARALDVSVSHADVTFAAGQPPAGVSPLAFALQAFADLRPLTLCTPARAIDAGAGF